MVLFLSQQRPDNQSLILIHRLINAARQVGGGAGGVYPGQFILDIITQAKAEVVTLSSFVQFVVYLKSL